MPLNLKINNMLSEVFDCGISFPFAVKRRNIFAAISWRYHGCKCRPPLIYCFTWSPPQAIENGNKSINSGFSKATMSGSPWIFFYIFFSPGVEKFIMVRPFLLQLFLAKEKSLRKGLTPMAEEPPPLRVFMVLIMEVGNDTIKYISIR